MSFESRLACGKRFGILTAFAIGCGLLGITVGCEPEQSAKEKTDRFNEAGEGGISTYESYESAAEDRFDRAGDPGPMRSGLSEAMDSAPDTAGRDRSNRAELFSDGRRESKLAPSSEMGIEVDRLSMSPIAEAVTEELRVPTPVIPDDFNTEEYDKIEENSFTLVKDEPLSTFSIDVDTASYANVRRFLTEGRLPPAGAVRIEEMVNYFEYNDPAPSDDEAPFAVSMESASCPWKPDHKLVRIGIKGRILEGPRPDSNLVFLIDVSGSMNSPDKLPLLVESMKMLVRNLRPRDRVAIVVYAGSSGLVLDSTSGDQKDRILGALDRLQAGGSTNGGQGIELAYRVAADHFIEGGVNRVILASDGDFNVGVTDRGSLVDLIAEKAESGVFLSVLGFGRGNLQDAQMEAIADRGNGNYAYIDSMNEGRRVLVDQISSTLVTIAKDVKLQVEFNPMKVAAFRLIGYENRVLAHQDFNDDRKDAGEIGAGHSVTALYEVVPLGVPLEWAGIDDLKYQEPRTLSESAASDELLTLKLRYKEPDAETSQLLSIPLDDSDVVFDESSRNLRFAAAVAQFGMILRDSPHRGAMSLEDVRAIARDAIDGRDDDLRWEFLDLVGRAISLGASGG